MGKSQDYRQVLTKLLSTFFYVGYLPLMPGTFGSLAGLLFFLLARKTFTLYALLTLFILILGFWVCGRAEKAFQKKDPRYVVIDEVAGIMLAMIFVPFDWRLVICGFFLFRLFDTLKPYPVSIFQDMKGSLGIMGDDIVAAIYANLTLQIVARSAVFKIS